MLELTAGKVATMYDSELGFRHGPKSIIDDNTLTVAYLSDDEYRRRYELDLVREMAHQRKGNKLLLFTTVIARKLMSWQTTPYKSGWSANCQCAAGVGFCAVCADPCPYKIAVFGYHPGQSLPDRRGESCSQGCDPVPLHLK